MTAPSGAKAVPVLWRIHDIVVGFLAGFGVGTVAGVVVSASTTDPELGYAISADEVAILSDELQRLTRLNRREVLRAESGELRALLAMKLDYVRATQIAAGIGQGMALLFAFVGLFSNPFLLFIALFVWIGATQEAAFTQVRSALAGIPRMVAKRADVQRTRRVRSHIRSGALTPSTVSPDRILLVRSVSSAIRTTSTYSRVPWPFEIHSFFRFCITLS